MNCINDIGGAQCPKPSVFSSSVGWNRMLNSPISQNPSLTDKRDRLAGLFAVARANNILVFMESKLRSNLEAGDHFLSISSTT